MVYKRGIKVRKRCEYCACSLVNKDIPSNVVAAGNPCKIICTLDEYRKKHKDDFMYIVNLTYERKKEFLLKYFRLNE